MCIMDVRSWAARKFAQRPFGKSSIHGATQIRSAEESVLNSGALVSWVLWCRVQLPCDLVMGKGLVSSPSVCFHLLLLNQGKLQGGKPEARREKERWLPHTLCPPLAEAHLALGSVLTAGKQWEERCQSSCWQLGHC